MIDLHVHSTYSDGTYTVEELVDYAVNKGLSAIALTDHDTIDGLDEIIDYAKDKPVEVIPGIEFSTEYEGKDIHILGYFFDYSDENFKKKLVDFVDSRELRNAKMCDKLAECGLP
ncbi:MAG: PHP domain-containing protein, partial [Lachnospiraceae bacterium]|nr:PHP domain-containing protein [Lachnospiraceae bacterium]